MPDGPRESPFHEPLRNPAVRNWELRKMLPVLFVLCTIGGLYLIYTVCHCLPMLQLMVPAQHIDSDMRQRGLIETVVFNVISFMLVLCYIRCVMVHPGFVPESFVPPNAAQGQTFRMDVNLKEKKRDGGARHCKWCGKYKPDRCHHCRVCNTCILKMDHHCPWIYNCVGFRNYKYFFLLLFYVMLDVHLIFWTMMESMVRYVQVDTSFLTMFCTLFGLTISFFLLSLVTVFFGFHCWLGMKGMTTIEFCEKKMPKEGGGSEGGSLYDLGFCGNIRAILGNDVLLWLLPFGEPGGVLAGQGEGGLVFETNQGREYLPHRDLEWNRGLGRRSPGKAKKGEQQYSRHSLNKLPTYGGTDNAAHDLITGKTLWAEKPIF